MSVLAKVPSPYKDCRLDRNFLVCLQDFNRQLQQVSVQVGNQTTANEGDALHRRVLNVLENSAQACREFEARFGHDPKLIKEAQSLFRAETDALLGQSWFTQRARTKPRGFVGDYDMLNKIYDKSTPAVGLGAYLDLCMMELPLARAVRGRMKLIRQFLLTEIGRFDRPVRILDIASGPCREFTNWPAQDHAVEVVALDSDEESIDYVQTNVAPALSQGTSLQSVQYNALRTRAADKTIAKFGRFDIIYSVGLCDYLSDELLVRLLAGWKQTLTEDGVMCVAFKDTYQYDKTPYQWHLDWFFYQRTEQDVLDIYQRAGFDISQMQLHRDETNIIINFVNRAERAAIQRTDTAQEAVAIPKLNGVRHAPMSAMRR